MKKSHIKKPVFSRTTTTVIGLVAAALIFIAATNTVQAEDETSAEASVDILSKYVWRGYELSKDSLVIQPSMTMSYNGFALNLWGNFDTDYYFTDSSTWNETDITLSYDSSYEKLSYEAGWVYYALDDGIDDTQEIYAILSYDVFLSPSLEFYYDIDDFSGTWYAALGISHTFEIAEKYELELGFQAGYVDEEGYSAFHDGLASVSMTFPLNDYVYITPALHWSFPLTNQASEQIKTYSFNGDDDSFVYGGITVNSEF
jgi:hypothetical protein